MTIFTRGEKIEGQFVYAEGWDSMLGATLSVNHSSVITLTPVSPEAGTFSGSAWAFITVSLSGDGSRLYGTYWATLTGDYLITADGIIFDNVVDSGRFSVAGREGRSFVTASGDWMATLTFQELPPPGSGIYTLAGPAQITGEYRTMGRGW
jgi:hypothetical protein